MVSVWRSNQPRPVMGETVPVENVPSEPGEYGFACPMGMFRGKLIVE